MIHGPPESFDELDDIMNGEVKECLGPVIPEEIVWGGKTFNDKCNSDSDWPT